MEYKALNLTFLDDKFLEDNYFIRLNIQLPQDLEGLKSIIHNPEFNKNAFKEAIENLFVNEEFDIILIDAKAKKLHYGYSDINRRSTIQNPMLIQIIDHSTEEQFPESHPMYAENQSFKSTFNVPPEIEDLIISIWGDD